MNISFKLLVAAAVFAASFTVGAQTIFSTSGYSTGEALEKPMVMKPFVEFSKARPLPELRIFTLEGEKVDLAKYRGKLLILNVWGTWCTPCIREIFKNSLRAQTLRSSVLQSTKALQEFLNSWQDTRCRNLIRGLTRRNLSKM